MDLVLQVPQNHMTARQPPAKRLTCAEPLQWGSVYEEPIMNRNIGILFGVVAPTDRALADDVSVETTPFASTATRAEVVTTVVREQSFISDSSTRKPHAQIDHRALVH